MQDNARFYCGDRLATRREVDHFLAWSRWPNDAVENLVIADHRNNSKSDHLAADDLAQLVVDARWTSKPARTHGLIVNTYAHVASGTPLWLHGSRFELATGPIHLDAIG